MTSVILDYRNPPPLFDIGAVWTILWRRRLLVVLVTVATIIVASLYILVTPASYTATAAILVDPRDIKTTNIDSVLPGIGADSAAIASQVSVIQSRDLLGKVFDKLGLAADPEFAATGGGLLGMLRPAKPAGEEVALQKFLHAVDVEREGLTYVIDVTVKSASPEKAARIANAVVEQYIAANGAQQTNAAANVTSTLNSRITALQADVSAAERAVADFKQQNGIYDETTGGTVQSQIDAISAQMITAQDALSQAQARLDQAKAAGTSPAALLRLSDALSSPAMDALRTDYNQKAAALASAQATLGPRHPTVVQANAELAKVVALLSREAARISRQLQSDRDLAAANLDKLNTALTAMREKAGEMNLAQVQLRQLQGKADAARKVLDDFQQRSQETAQIEGLQNQQVHLISRAAAPTDATWPKPALLLPVSAVLGLLAGSGLALLLGARTSQPSPAPAPITPDRPRRERSLARANPAELPRSSARRYASLDTARREIFGTEATPLTNAVQDLLREVLAVLPTHGGPFVLAVTARDPELAAYGTALAAMGLERIGGKALVAEPGETPGDAAAYRFILVGETHHLAPSADLDIRVASAAELRHRPLHPGEVALVLPAESPQRPHLVPTSAPRPTRVAAVQ
jgi:uncharacterized protein involved in exopolysaccharide biosynthesis